MTARIFIDGQHGTTGLEIHQRLAKRDDITLLEIPVEARKDPKARGEYLNAADIVFLCLPDDAAREAVALVTNANTSVIDASTAHRVKEGWVYGIPELNPGQRDLIRGSTRVCVPGCYASGFALCLHPLVAGGIVPPDYPVTSHAVTGYSGGGRQMIATYEGPDQDRQEIASRPKNLNLGHKHLPEMQKYGLLTNPPLFFPVVGDYYRGMLVFVPLILRLLPRRMTADQVRSYLEGYYAGERFVKVKPKEESEAIADGFLSPLGCNGTNMLEIFVFSRGDNVLLVARLDNLGKGASGAAVQNMNLLLGGDEGTGL
jgi:N-acetyl-gamma-glutamyl-phosphate reductase